MNKSIKLKNGKLISTDTGKATVSSAINEAFTDEKTGNVKSDPKFNSPNRRYVDDLPLPAPQSRAVAIVLAYSLWGLTAGDISFVLGTDVEKIEEIKLSEPYRAFLDGILQNVRDHDMDFVRRKLNGAALTAAEKMARLVSSNDEKVAQKAAADILDRNNFRPVDVHEHKISVEGGLVVRIIDDTKKKDKDIDIDVGV